jgi:cystathionine gamma-synthase
MPEPRKPSTIVAAARPDCDSAYGSVSPPLWTSDTFRWEDAETKPAYDYARTVSPNRDLLANALAELEGATGGVITNSGQSAALLALLHLPAGARIVAPHDCYGGTYRLLKGLEDRGKLEVTFVDMLDPQAFSRALGARAELVWVETPSNPLLRISDIARCAAEAKVAGALVVADNTLPTPCRQKPLELGCDMVMHSTTKALNGHADLFGGALLAKDPALLETLQWWSNAAGLNGSAHDAWQTLRGLRTLPLRIAQQEASARAIAEWLASHPQVQTVHFPGLASHAGYEIALRQQTGPGFMLSFRLRGGDAAARPFLKALELITLASSLGSFATLICQPSTMTHRGMPPDAQKDAGIYPDLLRLSVGLEDTQDILADLERAFSASQ